METTNEAPMSRVYIKTDEKSRIIACEGGYTINNIKNIDEWIFIDEGYGDKYNLCQTHYFEGGLFTEEMVCRYKYENGVAVLRAEEEVNSDIPNPVPTPTDDSDVWNEMAQAINEGVNEV